MPYRPGRRELYLNLNIWKLIFGITFGLWLGALAIGGTAWLAYRVLANSPWMETFNAQAGHGALPTPPAPVPTKPSVAAPPIATAPAVPEQQPPQPGTQQPAVAPTSATEVMFDKYQQNLTEAQQLQEQAIHNQRFNSPTCQFWLQQEHNAPSENAQNNVRRNCD